MSSLLATIKRKVTTLFTFLNVWRKVRQLDPNLGSEELLKFLFRKDIHPKIGPWQVPEEITQLATLLEERKPKTVLEIGTANGGTLFIFSRLADDEALLMSIDLPDGEYGGGYPKWKVPLFRSYPKKGQRLELLRLNSHKPESVAVAKRILDGKELDFLFIDADHTYEGVKTDFELYSPLVKKGGIIAFHDITPESTGKYGVPQFWNEVKQHHKHEEFVKEGQPGCGLGVLHIA